MSCQIETIADCGDILTIGRALFIQEPEKQDSNWLSQCSVSLSPCGSLLAVANKDRLCLLSPQWISATDGNTYLVSWSGTMPSYVTAILVLPLCPLQQSSQNGADWFCVVVGFQNGFLGFYTNTGHLLFLEKIDEKPIIKISCHTGTYGILPDDVHVLLQNSECIIDGSMLFPTLRNAKSQLAKVQAGVQNDYVIDNHNISIRKWIFTDQENINDAAVVGLDIKNAYDHLLAASTYGGYDTWYRSIPPMNTLILGAGAKPFVGFHHALEGGITPPLQDVARAVANKFKSALPGWLGGATAKSSTSNTEPRIRSESLSMRYAIHDSQRQGASVVVSPDRRLAAVIDNLGRVAVLDVNKGHIIRLFKGYRDAQCAFIQVFDQDEKKPQLSVIKEIKRAIFLIIYTAKKGLIDIRVMQSGHRIAVFTATKNGKLMYNTCGLVGTEQNYVRKKLNLPELQCVLMDPDGKLKTINIPFHFALESKHSSRSKDLHIIRELKDFIKKTSRLSDHFEDDIIQRVSELNTIELKKYCLEMLIKKHNVSPNVVVSCLLTFVDEIKDSGFEVEIQKIKQYFTNLGLVTLFYQRLCGVFSKNMELLMNEIHTTSDIDLKVPHQEIDNIPSFVLLEDDSCILDRLLMLAQENEYKDHHTKVTFADSDTHVYKEFLSYFALDEKSTYISLKCDLSTEKIDSLAAETFKLILRMENFKQLSQFVKESNLNPKDIVRLIIVHFMNISLEQVTIELIEKYIEILYYICIVTQEATIINYNETSPWWQSIRDILVEMPCPLRSMMVAMACKSVCWIFENNCSGDEDAWESVTAESAKWGLLIGKLEDISILSIILLHKDAFVGKSLPILENEGLNVNLRYIYSRGKGSITELIAKWLCSMGVTPEAIVANELSENTARHSDSDTDDADGTPESLFLETNHIALEENPKIFKWVSLLKRQFPLSTLAAYVIANMSWEYAMAWQVKPQHTEYLIAIVQILNNISDMHLKRGFYTLLWSTYVKQVFETSCHLINKVGRLPQDAICLQATGVGNKILLKFLHSTTVYLENFVNCSSKPLSSHEKPIIRYEKIWEDNMLSLIEVAQNVEDINKDILNVNYQLSCSLYCQCSFDIKFSKPLDTLYDLKHEYLFEITENKAKINFLPSDKINDRRMKFLTKLVRAAVNTIAVKEDGNVRNYNKEEYINWIGYIRKLSDLWNIGYDYVLRQQVVALFYTGYDVMAMELLGMIKELELLLSPLIAISTQRLKQSLQHSSNQPEWIVTVHPDIYRRVKDTVTDPTIPAYQSLETTGKVMEILLNYVEAKSKGTMSIVREIKLVELIVNTCEVITQRGL